MKIFSRQHFDSITIVLGSLIVCSLLIGCSRTPPNITTASTIAIDSKGRTFSMSPRTIPIRPNRETHLQAKFRAETSRPIEVSNISWSWILDSDTLPTETKSLTIPPMEKPVTIRVRADITWKSANQESIFKETVDQKIHLAVASVKPPESTKIEGYPIGTFPVIRSNVAYRGSKAVISRSTVPYYLPQQIQNPVGYLRSGDPVGLIKPVKSKKYHKTTIDGRTVWIPSSDLRPPAIILQHQDQYRPPKYYYPVTRSNKRGMLLPGMKWNEFDHDQFYRNEYGPDYPHYIPLKDALLEKLMGIRSLLKEKRYPTEFTLVSGLRNPHYNQDEVQQDGSLKALFSRHQYGDAVDLIVDGDGDGRMDDLNNDGQVDISDAEVLGDLIAKWENRTNRSGGIGIYSHHDVKGRVQTPYVHIDCRGYEARWTIQ